MLDTRSIFAGFTVPPSIQDIEDIAGYILDDLPDGLRKHVGKLKVAVEDFPDDFIMQEMEVDSPYDLLSCYQSSGPASVGRLNSKSKNQDTIYLYRRPVLDMWIDSEQDITILINRIIINEIGTHLGFNNHEIEMYEEDILGTDDALSYGVV